MKPEAEAMKQKLLQLLNKPVRVSFGPHAFTVTIDRIEQARLADLANKPDKRIAADGTAYTPTVLTLGCGAERLYIYIEDVRSIVQTLAGIVITMVSGDKAVFTWA